MALPVSFKQLVVTKLTPNFREAVSIQSTILNPPSGRNVLIKNRFVGINASSEVFKQTPPFGIGYEGLGVVVSVGEEVSSVSVGDTVAYWDPNANAYGEYVSLAEERTFSIPSIKPEYLALPISGLAAAIGLDKSARVIDGETVLITAAAGGVGHIAVQWAKAAGCHVIGTCSTQAKADLLKELGCDRVINHKTEDVDAILSKEYPKGVDVIWETVGGEFLKMCLKHLATKGRLLMLGGTAGYHTGEGVPQVNIPDLPQLLLPKSAGIQAFRLLYFAECYQSYFSYLIERTVHEELRIVLDNGTKSVGHEFIGLDGIFEAIEHLNSGTSIGKVIVKIN